MGRNPRWLVASLAALLLALLAAGPATAQREASGRAVERWIDANAHPISTRPGAALADLAPLRRIVGPAAIVGLGESTHGSHEQFQVKARMARFLVERMGFRTIAFEEDFAGGIAIDRYVRTGRGDPRAIVADMSFPFWRSREILDLVRWMRAYDRAHPGAVRFLGTDIIALRRSSFDAVLAYARRVAPERLSPERLAALERDLALVRPTHPPDRHTGWYVQLPAAERRPLIAAARRIDRVVRGLPSAGLEDEYAHRHALAIARFHESFAKEGFRAERERFVASTLDWWRRVAGGGRIAYLAADAHVAAARRITFREAGRPQAGTFAGGYLRQRHGRRYVAIGTVFHHGAISSDFMRPGPHRVLAPPARYLEARLAAARAPDYLLDLRAPAPAPVRAWRAGPAIQRMILPSYNADDDAVGYDMAVRSLSGAYDALVNVRVTTPSRLLS